MCSCRLASFLDMQVLALRAHLLHSAKVIEKTHASQVPSAGSASRDPSVPTRQEWIQEGIRLGDVGRTLDEQLKVHPLCVLACGPRTLATFLMICSRPINKCIQYFIEDLIFSTCVKLYSICATGLGLGLHPAQSATEL